ncbi:hypothetical protein MSM1_17875 [Mycobacterium sp. SM1]|uniref:hypothetical protein n=1 Tax=Mycobacterium sp. SM1 TaxID=2816243 RepID=UPI001BCEDA8C|nr:hypothetical protein [Mycobacterium sp. SM1]MBS4730121.1 hypothetical protein [Mycobacterium sp. SM1]
MTEDDSGDNDATTTSYRSPFGTEVDMRESHLAALPGKVYHEWFESLNRASQVFSGNTEELMKHLTKFVGTSVHVSELPDGFDVEANRLLHNYLASLATLRDVQRMVHRKLWPERHAPDSDTDRRTTWEVRVWEPKVTEAFGDDSIKFLIDLRNFSLHYSIPPVRVGTTKRRSSGRPLEQGNQVLVDRAELLKWSGWKGASRRYIESHDGDIEFLPVVAAYSTKVREFFGWFWEQVIGVRKVRIDLAEYIGKSKEYWLWRHVEGTWGRYGPDGRSVQRPRLAAARLERADYGTSGWRLITVGGDGGATVGESDWPPLPPGPR